MHPRPKHAFTVPTPHTATHTLRHYPTSRSPQYTLLVSLLSLLSVGCISIEQILHKRTCFSPLNDRSSKFVDARSKASQPIIGTTVQLPTPTKIQYTMPGAVSRKPVQRGGYSRTAALLQCPTKPTSTVQYWNGCSTVSVRKTHVTRAMNDAIKPYASRKKQPCTLRYHCQLKTYRGYSHAMHGQSFNTTRHNSSSSNNQALRQYNESVYRWTESGRGGGEGRLLHAPLPQRRTQENSAHLQ